MAFVRSIIQLDFDYCSSIWNDGSAGISAKLQRIERDVYESSMVVMVGRLLVIFHLYLQKWPEHLQDTSAFYLGSLAHRCFYSLAPSKICF